MNSTFQPLSLLLPASSRRVALGVLLLAGTLQACGSGGEAAPRVDPPALTIDSESLPPAEADTAYAATLVASGGAAPYTWSLSAGTTLPPGLELAGTGEISGVPTSAGLFDFGVTATDSASPAGTAAQDLGIQVIAAPSSGPNLGPPVTTIRALIDGHSLTDEPFGSTLEATAPPLGLSFQWQRHNIPGSPIRYRTAGATYPADTVLQSGTFTWPGYSMGNNNGTTNLDLINELRNPAYVSGGDYTHLVLAENHNSIDMLVWEGTVRFARHFHEQFLAASPAGKTYLFGTWKDFVGVGASASSPSGWVEHERQQVGFWECIVSRINESLAQEGRTDRIACLPANGALAELVDKATNGNVAGITQGSVEATMSQIFSDDVHLTSPGKYFVSMCAHVAMYRTTCVGAATVSGVSTTQAASLQQVAWDYMSAYYDGLPNGPQHTFSQRQALVTAFVTTYFTYRGQTSQIAGRLSQLTAADLSNPLYTAADESGYWYADAP